MSGTGFPRLLAAARLDRQRPQARDGCLARRAATLVLHTCCAGLDRNPGRPGLALAALLGRQETPDHSPQAFPPQAVRDHLPYTPTSPA